MTNSLAPRLLHTALPQKSGVPVEPAPASTRRVNSRTLLGQSTSLIIDHEGVSYILRATRLGKLILTK
jgi:hemin uptake protein HemP